MSDPVPTEIVPRAHMLPTSPEWLIQTIGRLRHLWFDLDGHYAVIDRTIEELKNAKAWERWPLDRPCGSFDALLLGEIEVTYQKAIELVCKAKSRAEATQEAARGNPEPLREHGANQHHEEVLNSKSSTSSKRGSTSAPYRIRKLRRDHPDIAKRLDAGEFKSVAAAERAAKGLEPNPPRKKSSPLVVLRSAWARASASERLEFLSQVTKEPSMNTT